MMLELDNVVVGIAKVVQHGGYLFAVYYANNCITLFALDGQKNIAS